MNKNSSMYVYMFGNDKFERPRTGLKDNTNIDHMEICFGLERII
jgi:hypothetical protein